MGCGGTAGILPSRCFPTTGLFIPVLSGEPHVLARNTFSHERVFLQNDYAVEELLGFDSFPPQVLDLVM